MAAARQRVPAGDGGQDGEDRDGDGRDKPEPQPDRPVETVDPQRHLEENQDRAEAGDTRDDQRPVSAHRRQLDPGEDPHRHQGGGEQPEFDAAVGEEADAPRVLSTGDAEPTGREPVE